MFFSGGGAFDEDVQQGEAGGTDAGTTKSQCGVLEAQEVCLTQAEEAPLERTGLPFQISQLLQTEHLLGSDWNKGQKV